MTTQVRIAHEGRLMEEMTQAEKYEHISSALQASQEGYKSLAMSHRRTLERLNTIEPLYQKMYCKWWIRWFYLPYDAVITGRMLFRCQTCGGMFWLGGEKEFTTHKGHKYAPCREYSFWEHLKILTGRVR